MPRGAADKFKKKIMFTVHFQIKKIVNALVAESLSSSNSSLCFAVASLVFGS